MPHIYLKRSSNKGLNRTFHTWIVYNVQRSAGLQNIVLPDIYYKHTQQRYFTYTADIRYILSRHTLHTQQTYISYTTDVL